MGILGEAKVDEVIDTKWKWKAHGLLMGLAWGVLVPIAIASALLRNVLPLPPGMWYKLHMRSNSLASMMTIIGIGLAVSAINDEKGDGADHFSQDTHHMIGGIILVFTILQVMNGFLRPHAPGPHAVVDKQENEEESESMESHREESDKSMLEHGMKSEMVANQQAEEILEDTEDSSNHEGGEEKTKVRSIWEKTHRAIGVTTLALAWYNCSSGIDFYEGRYSIDMNLTLGFWVIVGLIAGGTLLVKYGATSKSTTNSITTTSTTKAAASETKKRRTSDDDELKDEEEYI